MNLLDYQHKVLYPIGKFISICKMIIFLHPYKKRFQVSNKQNLIFYSFYSVYI